MKLWEKSVASQFNFALVASVYNGLQKLCKEVFKNKL